jgi:hypothetical protein
MVKERRMLMVLGRRRVRRKIWGNPIPGTMLPTAEHPLSRRKLRDLSSDVPDGVKGGDEKKADS